MKKIYASLLVVLLMFSILLPSALASQNQNNDYISRIDDFKVTKKAWYEIAWEIINFTLDTIWYKSPTYSLGLNADTISSGSITFNSKADNTGNLVRHDVEVDIPNRNIFAWVKGNILDWTRRMNIIITDTKGNDHSKVVKVDEWYGIRADVKGTYNVRFVTSENHKWDNWVAYYHNKGPCPIIGEPCMEPLGLKVNTVNMDGNGVNLNIIEADGSMFELPSENHKQKVSLNSKSTKNESLTLIDLYDQLYDKQIERHVYMFKNYQLGDTIYFKDVIQDLKYDKMRNETDFGFKDYAGDITYWPFAGNLLNEYKVGSEIELQFKVVKRTDQLNLETIDYIQFGLDNDGKAPSITDYLKVN